MTKVMPNSFITSLKPFISITFFQVQERKGPKSQLESFIDFAKSRAQIPSGADLVIESESGAFQESSLWLSLIHYQHIQKPAWTSDQKLKDTLNHLVLVAIKDSLGAALLTEASKARAIAVGIRGSTLFKPIEETVLNAAFAKGKARTLWLSGLHSPTSLKADSKVLSGTELRDALDPMRDQTYCFTTLRASATLNSKPVVIGLSPMKSRAWTGASKDWDSCVASVTALLDRLKQTQLAKQSEPSPIPILATAESKISGVRKAYRIGLYPSETLSESLEQEEAAFLAEWTESGEFTVTRAKGKNGSAEAYLNGVLLGKIHFKIDVANSDEIQVQISSEPVRGHENSMGSLEELCKLAECFRIDYESSHCLMNRRIYRQNYRDVRFPHWQWGNFKSYLVWKEKPRAEGAKSHFSPELIGQSDSLFCWLQKESDWGKKGWLACDDGSGEIADFLHWDPVDPTLTLIHVKGAKKGKKPPEPGQSRAISGTDYEIVTAQAIKNLRNLDKEILAMGVKKGLQKLNSSVWYNGVASTKKDFLAALPKSIQSFRRKVVIIQPRVVQKAYEDAHDRLLAKKLPPAKKLQLLQLETLLVNTGTACQALGASLTVIGDGT